VPAGPERPPRVGFAIYKRFALAGLLIALLTGGAVATAGLLKVKDIADTLAHYGHKAHLRPDTITRAEAGDPQTLLLVGSDHRYGTAKDDARSDTLMLVRLDPDQPATTVLSIPRDLVTEIPGHGTQKINAAYSYGGLDLTVRTVKRLLSTPGHPFRINHAIGVSFDGFKEGVNRLGCIYMDVDRRYYHSNAGLPPSLQYAEINIQPGYQKLCGDDALSFVRFRHADNDLVRAARQQDFLRAVKDQVGAGGLLGELGPLTKIFAKASEFDDDLASEHGLLRLARLAAYSAGHPVREVHFPATFVAPPVNGAAADPGIITGLGDYVTATPDQVQQVLGDFLHPKAPKTSSGPKKRSGRGGGGRHRGHKAPKRTAADYGLVDARTSVEDLVASAVADGRLRFPLYYPSWLTPGGRLVPDQPPNAPMPRIYTIKDRDGHRHRAYRIVVMQNQVLGQYYGVEGTTWRDPPILQGGETKKMRGRAYRVLYDGSHVRVVAWETPKAVYWVSNTLTLDLSNDQMLGIARSLVRFGQ
jgi:LCP family protein required for cell wall assembly